MIFMEFLNLYPSGLYIFIIILSLIVGSLLNVIIYRLPIMLQAEWQAHCCELLNIQENHAVPKINLFLPRSFCPHCKKQISAWHNIPLLSFLLLKGRCWHCKASISLKYPFIELLTMLLSVYATWHFGPNLQLVFVLLAMWIVIPLIFIDLEHHLLPDCLTLSLLWLGLIANSWTLFTTLDNAIFTAIAAYLSLWVFIKLYYLITGKIGMGNGDFKLFAALGAWLGWMYLPLILLLSSLSGAIIGTIYLHRSNQPKTCAIPFGPFLGVSGLICLFWGPQIINEYRVLLSF